MEETLYEEKPGIFGRIAGIFTRPDEEEPLTDLAPVPETRKPTRDFKPSHRYTVSVRREILSFEDALAAANGVKSGEQQILNLAQVDVATRNKIVDFMSGVNFAEEGTWEELGENIYMIAPPAAYIEVVPPTPRMNSVRN